MIPERFTAIIGDGVEGCLRLSFVLSTNEMKEPLFKRDPISACFYKTGIDYCAFNLGRGGDVNSNENYLGIFAFLSLAFASKSVIGVLFLLIYI